MEAAVSSDMFVEYRPNMATRPTRPNIHRLENFKSHSITGGNGLNKGKGEVTEKEKCRKGIEHKILAEKEDGHKTRSRIRK
jgi:hypothetical protein